MALLRRDRLARDRARSAESAAAARSPSATAVARRFDVVSRMAEASTSCSACASMSAARKRGSPSAAMIRISVGPATKSMPDFARQQLLRRRDVDVAGTDDAVGLGHRARAEGERRDGLRAAHLENVGDSQQPRRAQNLRQPAWGRPRRCSARPPPAPESPSSSASKAADSGPRECRRPPYRAAARSGPGAGRARSRSIHAARHLHFGEAREYWRTRSRRPSRNCGRELAAGRRQLALRHAHALAARGRRTCARIPAAPCRRACARLPESDAPPPRPRSSAPRAARAAGPSGWTRGSGSSLTSQSCSADTRQFPARPPASAAG